MNVVGCGDWKSRDLDSAILRPVVPLGAPEEGVRASFIMPDQEQLNHHASEHERTLMWETLRDDFVQVMCGHEAVYVVEGIARDEKVDVLVRARCADPVQLLGPAAEDAHFERTLRQKRHHISNEFEVMCHSASNVTGNATHVNRRRAAVRWTGRAFSNEA